MPRARRLPLAPTALAVLSLVPAALVSQQAFAWQDTGDSVQKQIDRLQQELNRVQQENSAMRGEIDQLRAESNDQWLTEQRSNEIKALVHDVLADADTRASLLDTGMTAGWNEHFFLASSDGRFLLQLEGLMQIRFVYNHHESPDRWRYGFENTRTQLAFSGHVFDENVEYMIRGEFGRSGGNQSLLDSWVRYRFDDKMSVRFGQFKLPYNREYLVGDGQGLAVERSIVAELFSVKRSQGVEFEYVDMQNRVAAAFSDGGSASITGTNTANGVWSAQDTEWSVTGRYERLISGTWEQFADMTSPPNEDFALLAGIGAHAQQGESTGQPTFNRDESRFVQFTADVSAEWGGANVFASGYYGYLDSPNGIFDIWGFVIQAGVFVAPKWELFGRFEAIIFDSDVPTLDDFSVVTGGVNYYMDGHDLKWTTDISLGLDEVSFAPDITGFRQDSEGDDPQIVLRTQFQLIF